MDMDQCEQGGGVRFLLYWRTSFMDDSLLHGKCSGTRFAATTSAGGGGLTVFTSAKKVTFSSAFGWLFVC